MNRRLLSREGGTFECQGLEARAQGNFREWQEKHTLEQRFHGGEQCREVGKLIQEYHIKDEDFILEFIGNL